MTAKFAPDTTMETELNVLAAIYRRAVERYEEAKAAERSQLSGCDDKEGRSSDGFHADEQILPK